jgi:NADH dehydrogenase FAD-containing subunit
MKRIGIVGAGFAGLAAAKELRHSDAEVFVVDRRIKTSFSGVLRPHCHQGDFVSFLYYIGICSLTIPV